jgi:signal peptidase I
VTPAVKAQILEYVESFVTAAILAAVIIIFIGQNFVVQGSSMEPNLHNRERLFVEKISYRFHQPKRGEIVVFKYPLLPKRKFIKRVVGVPGDEVKIRENKVYVNGTRLDEEYLDSLTYGEFGPVYVPPGHIFVLGDNRNNSEDSRFRDVGFVPFKNVVGRACFRWWPPTKMKVLRRPEIFLQLDKAAQ